MQVLVCSGVINLSSPFKSASFLIINRKPRAAIIKMLKWPAKQPAIPNNPHSQQSTIILSRMRAPHTWEPIAEGKRSSAQGRLGTGTGMEKKGERGKKVAYVTR